MAASSAAPTKSATPPRREFKFVFQSAADLVANQAPLQWLIATYFEVATLVLFFGDAASCKTWLVLSMAIHIAAGIDFFGNETLQGAVFIVAGEGNRGLRRRVAGLLKHYELDAKGLPLYISTSAMSASEDESVADVIAAINELVVLSGQRPVLVVIDTVSRNFGNGDENSTQHMAQFVRSCDWIRNEFECTVLLIHHVGHQDKGRARGNTTLRGALDTEFRVQRDEAGIIEVACTKAKDFEQPEPRRFVLTGVDLDWIDDDGTPVRSAALVPTDALPVSPGKTGRGRNQVTALRILNEIEEHHRQNRIDGGHDPEYARVRTMEWRSGCEREGFNRQRFGEVSRSLLKAGLICFDDSFVRTVSLTK